MTADLTPAQAARLEAIEAAPYAEEAAVERAARAMWDAVRDDSPWEVLSRMSHRRWRTAAVAAIDVMRGAADDGAIGFCVCWDGSGAVEPARDCGIPSHRARARTPR